MRLKIEPYISSSTDYILKRTAASELFMGFKGDTFQIKIRKPDGSFNSFVLVHAPCSVRDIYPREENNELLDFKWVDHDIAYIALNSFDDAKIDTLFLQILPKLYKAKGLIIDIRNNGGGSTEIGTNILKYLTKDTLLYGEKVVTRLNNSYYRAIGGWIKSSDTIDNTEYRDCYLNFYNKYYYYFPFAPDTVKLRAKQIEIPTAILTGNNTASAAEDFLVYADKMKNMIRIGEKTYGSTGMPYVFNLPGGGSARVCTVEDTYSDGRKFVGFGVIPNIEVKPTVQDFIDHKDPVLDKALEYLKGKVGQ
jgi:C-terminal processing protease CtpA/Prc